jgi:Ankyrin repeats (3 copies)
MSAPALKRQKTSDDPVCSCKTIQSAARAQHLPCLLKFLASPDLSEKSAAIDEALRLVAAHELHGSSVQPSDCTGCVRALLDIQTSASTTASAKRYKPQPEGALSLCAREGCIPCLETLLAHYMQYGCGLDRENWRVVLESAVRCSQLDSIQAIFRASSRAGSGKELQADLGHAAVQMTLEQHELLLIARGSEHSHTECGGMLRVLSWLLDQGYTCEGSDHDSTLKAALRTMVSFGCIEGANALSSKYQLDLSTVLHEACKAQHGSEMVRELVRLGADIYTVSSNGYNVLQTAVTHGSTDTVKALLKLEQGAASAATTTAASTALPFILQPFDDGDSVLHRAVSKSAQLLEALLLQKDTNVATALQMTDSSGRTVLHCAIELHRVDHVKLLLQAAVSLRVVRQVCDMKDTTDVGIACLVRRTGTAAMLKLLTPYVNEVSS